MSNLLKTQASSGRFGIGALVVTLALSVSAFGCTSNYAHRAGEPVVVTPSGGSVASAATALPGTAAVPMISGGVDASVDAVAVLEANRGFEGRVLGPAAPGNSVSLSQQHATGQFIPPAAYLGAAPTINRSVNSGSVPAIVSGAGPNGVIVNAGTGVAASAVVAPVQTSTGVAGANFGVTGVSNATATGIAGPVTPSTTVAGTTALAGTGVTVAPTALSSVSATPALGTSPRLNIGSPAASTGVRVETSATGRTVVTNSNP